MAATKPVVRCQVIGPRGGSQPCYLRLMDNEGIIFRQSGPYRDKTDAENAAEDMASQRGWELQWVYS